MQGYAKLWDLLFATGVDATIADLVGRARVGVARIAAAGPRASSDSSHSDHHRDMLALGEYVTCERYGPGRVTAIDVDPDIAGGEPVYAITFEAGWLHLRFAEHQLPNLGIERTAIGA